MFAENGKNLALSLLNKYVCTQSRLFVHQKDKNQEKSQIPLHRIFYPLKFQLLCNETAL